jgi:hypothetical protein
MLDSFPIISANIYSNVNFSMATYEDGSNPLGAERRVGRIIYTSADVYCLT